MKINTMKSSAIKNFQKLTPFNIVVNENITS